jgi:hypothetical protein
MHLGFGPMRPRSIQDAGLVPFATPVRPRIDQHGVEFATSFLRRDANSPRGASGRALFPQALYFRTDRTSMQGHDVSGTAWQTVNRTIEWITTTTPVRQFGHSRNDRPVNASKRSR